MIRRLRSWLPLLLAAACGRERAPGNDTAVAEGVPPAGEDRPAAVSSWDAGAGAFFAVRSPGGAAWLVNPAYGAAQALDTLATWDVEGTSLTLLEGGTMVGTGRVSALRYDSTCAGWPQASIVPDAGGTPGWRVAFEGGRVEGIGFDSLPSLAPADSAARARAGALAASRLPDDTATAFRGRPFIVRQASRFPVAGDTVATLYEVQRLVPQEANPLHEQILLIAAETATGDLPGAYHERHVGFEEAISSIEVVGVLRVKATGRVGILVRREREGGFVLEWIERHPRLGWRLRWRSAIDGC